MSEVRAKKVAQFRKCFVQNFSSVVEEQQLRIAEVAKRAGVSRAHLYNVLAGESGPSIDFVAKIAHALKCAPHTLLEPKKGGKKGAAAEA
jgi:transcriptional regulator with XRE-family HTH domain